MHAASSLDRIVSSITAAGTVLLAACTLAIPTALSQAADGSGNGPTIHAAPNDGGISAFDDWESPSV